MPVSMVVLASRPPEWTVDKFTTWWRGDHAEMAKRLPKLIAYRHGKVIHDFDHPESPAWDGHAVLTFPTREDLDAALASPQWAEAIRHVGAMKGKRVCLFTEEVDLLAGRVA